MDKKSKVAKDSKQSKETKKSEFKSKKAVLKRPMSAFFIYMGERRPKLLEEKPELKKTVKEVGKHIGDEWRKMTEQEKLPYIKRAEEEKEKYMTQKNTTNAEV